MSTVRTGLSYKASPIYCKPRSPLSRIAYESERFAHLVPPNFVAINVQFHRSKIIAGSIGILPAPVSGCIPYQYGGAVPRRSYASHSIVRIELSILSPRGRRHVNQSEKGGNR